MVLTRLSFKKNLNVIDRENLIDINHFKRNLNKVKSSNMKTEKLLTKNKRIAKIVFFFNQTKFTMINV